MIDSIFEVFLNKLVGVSLLLLVLMAIRPFVLKYLNASASYGMWLIVPVFLLLPIDLFGSENSASVITIVLGENPLNPAQLNHQFFENDGLKGIVLIVWLIGLLTSTFLSFYRFRKLKFSLSEFIFSGDNLENTINNKSKINIVKSQLVDVPAIFGLFRSNLILPNDFSSFPKNNQKMILRHELYHLARHDHRINVVRLIVKSLFWFNPLIFIADKYCEADQEISCDLGVLQGSSQQEKQQYAKALIDSASLGSQNQLVSQWKYHSLIKERVKMLKNTNTKMWHKWVAIVFSIGALWTTNGVVMAEKSIPEDSFDDIRKVATKFVMSRYPRQAAMDGIEGHVKIRFDIDKNGELYNIDLLESVPSGVFDKDALIAVNQWRFENNKGQNNMVYTLEYLVE